MRKTRLFTPGPTPLLPEAQLALAQPLIHHRTPEFRRLLADTLSDLGQICKTTQEILLLSSSGTGAMEAAVSNFHSPGDKVIAVVAGKFGERWAELAHAFGLQCVSIRKNYGEAASAAEILSVLRENPGARSLLLQGCETSTATSHDLESIGRSVSAEFPEVLIIVDAISAIASQPLEFDAWRIDVLVCGSQKAFGVPPGLAFLALSRKALSRLAESSACPRYYLDLRRELAGQRDGITAFTPSIALVSALKAATGQMLREGIDTVIDTAALMARATRRGLKALGFSLLSSSPANAVTAAFPPPAVGADELRKSLETDFGIKVAGGQGMVKGKVIRIAHLGYFDILDVFSVLSAIELSLDKKGIPFPVGAGLLAAMEEVRASRAVPI